MKNELNFFEKLHYLHRCFRYRFRTEKQQLAKLLAYNLRGETVFDVGGNHGIYAYWLTKAVGPLGFVHVFEPQPELVLEMEKVANWLKFDSIKLNPVALSDGITKKILNRRNIGDGSASLENISSSQLNNNHIEIQTITLDDYCLQNGVSSMGYLKIDVEGHEFSVIQGGLNTIKKLRPIIQIELRVHEPSCDQVISTLTNLGYSGVMLCDEKEISLSHYKKVPSKKFGLSGHRDFIFEPAVMT